MGQLIPTDLTKEKISQSLIWNDDLIQNYYTDLSRNMSLKELDDDFNYSLKKLSKLMSKLNDNEKKIYIELFGEIINHYVEQKVEKQIELFFNKTLKI